MRAVRLVLRLKKGGLLVMGPPCSSFVMLNAVNCKRKLANNYRGDEAYPPVQLGNLLATVTAFLMTVACLRGVEVVVENPPGSTIWNFPELRQVLDAFVQRSVVTPRCPWSREPWGRRMLKYFKFVCTGTWISAIRRRCQCPGRKHFKLTWGAWRHGKLTFTGKRQALQQSAAYPDALGQAIVSSWQNGSASHMGARSLADSWLQPNPGPSAAAQHSVQRSVRLRKRSSASSAPWLEPSPGACTSSSTSSSWLTPSPGPRAGSTSVEESISCTPTWLNPSPTGA